MSAPEFSETGRHSLLAEFARRIGHHFDDLDELDLAFRHRSWCAENGGQLSNERLEFLGDAVLQLVVTERLYRGAPEVAEGTLAQRRAAVVNTKALATAARRVDLGECVRLGRGEAATGGADKDSILADCTEAVIGAVYLSAGLEPAAATIYRLLGVELAWVETGEDPGDPKSRLQELAAQQFEGGPRYEIGDTGPDHAKEFTAVVMLDGVAYGRGIGRTKKEAEQAAASQALAGIPANESRNT